MTGTGVPSDVQRERGGVVAEHVHDKRPAFTVANLEGRILVQACGGKGLVSASSSPRSTEAHPDPPRLAGEGQGGER
jgi:hypothetical protein